MSALTKNFLPANPLAQRTVAAAAITNTYALIGAIFGQNIVQLAIISTLDQAVQISFDGVTDHVAVPAGNTVPVYFTFDFKSNGIVLSSNLGIYVKEIGNPATGNLYVSIFSVDN